jgi:hypothetical protein
MTFNKPASSALPLARALLRVLIVINLAMVPVILTLLFLIPNREWIVSALELDPSLEADRIVFGLRAIASIGLVTVPLNHGILRRLLAMVDTVRAGDPFVATNALRLRTIAWAMLVLQCLGIVIGSIAKTVSTPAHPVNIDAGFSLTGWLAVLLTFLLARVFAEGTHMRDEIEGTV